MRTMPTSGDADCEMASEARGTPPNGNEKRNVSANAWASGSATSGYMLRDPTTEATPWNAANRITAMT